MSEKGWRAFNDADGVGDWVVLHGGPTAVYRVGDMGQAASLAAAMAQVPNLCSRAVLTIAADTVTVKLNREMWATEVNDIDLARAICAVAAQHGAVADRSAVQEVQLAIAAIPDAIDLGFWRTVLGYAPMSEDNCIDPLGQGSTVWMQDLNPSKPLRHAMHVDVSLSWEQARARVSAALAAGGRMVDDSEAPANWILADRSGNKVCVVSWPDGARAKAPLTEPIVSSKQLARAQAEVGEVRAVGDESFDWRSRQREGFGPWVQVRATRDDLQAFNERGAAAGSAGAFGDDVDGQAAASRLLLVHLDESYATLPPGHRTLTIRPDGVHTSA